MQDDNFNRCLRLSSVPLVRLNGQGIPDCIASGCLIDYCGKRILLTVSHATGDQKNWAIQLKYIPEKGTATYSLGAMNFLAEGSLSKPELQDVDFSYVEVPSSVLAYRQEIDPSSNSIKAEARIDVHIPSLEDEPILDKEYGFCGVVMPTAEHHFGQDYFGGIIQVYAGLSFLRTEGSYHVFALPFEHPGHEYFEGCSGAPILNPSGSLVALVCKGCDQSNEIWGISVKAYKTSIDVLVDNVA